MRILLVDDEPEILEVYVTLLAAAGAELETAGDGLSALELLERAAFDLVISDVRMPRMDGLALLRVAKSRWPETRFILVSGSSDAIEDGRRSGADVVVRKPFDPTAFLSLVTRTASIFLVASMAV